ncbi:Myxococcus xanthus paralogous domain TIGR02266 [Stigmatella erecta]|uniref:Myxococcus xanthus paralogous domain TIGR02266 n=2 Tax=Stigmatella erecta TaxID=83460 RepID=A0A1I0A528_9BACT|nr:Myxococcus xanthus paralogous domain TIGR02266 [Stigmatella erecta]
MENRKYARVTSRMRCWCRAEDVTLYSRVGNVSEGGLFMRTSTPLQTGARAAVRLGSGEKDGAEFQAMAKVVWARQNGQSRPPGMGLQFDALDDAAREQLRRIISHDMAASAGA